MDNIVNLAPIPEKDSVADVLEIFTANHKEFPYDGIMIIGLDEGEAIFGWSSISVLTALGALERAKYAFLTESVDEE